MFTVKLEGDYGEKLFAIQFAQFFSHKFNISFFLSSPDPLFPNFPILSHPDKDIIISPDTIPEKCYIRYIGPFKNYVLCIKEQLGDYLEDFSGLEVKYPLLKESYYLDIKRGDEVKFPENDHVYIFTEDPLWCLEKYKQNNNKTIIVENEKEKLYLMTKCGKGGNDNTYLSWWGYHFNKNPSKSLLNTKRNPISKIYIFSTDKDYENACQDAINNGYEIVMFQYDTIILQKDWESITINSILELEEKGEWDMFMLNCMGMFSWETKGLRKGKNLYLKGCHVLKKNVIGMKIEDIMKRNKTWFYFPFLALDYNNSLECNWTMENFYPTYKELFVKEKVDILIYGKAHHKNLAAIIRGCKFFGLKYKITENIRDIFTIDYDLLWSPDKYIDPKLLKDRKVMFGPHFFVFPDHSYKADYGKYHFYNCLSEWNKKIHFDFGFQIPLITSPFGVDTDYFTPGSDKTEIFIYFKRRDPCILNHVLSKIKSKPIIIKYGDYKELDYLEILKKSRYGIWIGCHESQGFALQEALSCNVPLLVINVKSMKDEYGNNYGPIQNNLLATTAQYWSSDCGEIIQNLEDFEITLHKLELNLNNYKPRQFILNNLSTEKCFQNLFSHYNIKL